MTLFNSEDLYYFAEGTHARLFDKLGARRLTVDGVEGAYFAVWAPNARQVSVMGSFNHWNRGTNFLSSAQSSGIWEGFIPGVKKGDLYKYFIVSKHNNHSAEKADPFGFWQEIPPKTASVVWELDYSWNDNAWLHERRAKNANDAPISIYEIHPGSWRRVPEEGNRWLNYRELAKSLAEYTQEMGFTHVELLPITEHPFYGSWGYQTTGFFAPTSRYGVPQDFMSLVDHLHQRGLGVILDWTPLHFPNDPHGLAFFDGTHLYEHPDPRKGYHSEWKSGIFNFERPEVGSFLLSSAHFWLEKYHLDGLRVDAVSYMLYLDYCKKAGQWVPNRNGGRENLDAVAFIKRLNDQVVREHPGAITVAEEATVWPRVSRPTSANGLGFSMKWDMGWMNDTLTYMRKPNGQRKQFHNKLTFRGLYAFHENFMLSLSHDEVVHGKGSLLEKMAGNDWEKFANLRLLFGYMYALPGKKLVFMGGEFGQRREWSHDQSLDWRLLNAPSHAGIKKWVTDLNKFYRGHPSLHELDFQPEGFNWIDCNDSDNCVINFVRKSRSSSELILGVFNFYNQPHYRYRLGISREGYWKEILNSDAKVYGGGGLGNFGGVHTQAQPRHRLPWSIELTLPPLSAIFFENGPNAQSPPSPTPLTESKNES